MSRKDKVYFTITFIPKWKPKKHSRLTDKSGKKPREKRRENSCFDSDPFLICNACCCSIRSLSSLFVIWILLNFGVFDGLPEFSLLWDWLKWRISDFVDFSLFFDWFGLKLSECLGLCGCLFIGLEKDQILKQRTLF